MSFGDDIPTLVMGTLRPRFRDTLRTEYARQRGVAFEPASAIAASLALLRFGKQIFTGSRPYANGYQGERSFEDKPRTTASRGSGRCLFAGTLTRTTSIPNRVIRDRRLNGEKNLVICRTTSLENYHSGRHARNGLGSKQDLQHTQTAF